jgi:hypothetical protein
MMKGRRLNDKSKSEDLPNNRKTISFGVLKEMFTE